MVTSPTVTRLNFGQHDDGETITRDEMHWEHGLAAFEDEAVQAMIDADTAKLLWERYDEAIHTVVSIDGQRAVLLIYDVIGRSPCVIKAVSNEFVRDYPEAPKFVQEIVDRQHWKMPP
jgi:hypothetical protein